MQLSKKDISCHVSHTNEAVTQSKEKSSNKKQKQQQQVI